MKSTRRWLCLLLALTLVFTLLPQIALPARAADDAGQCGFHLGWSFRDSTGELIITAEEGYDGEMFNYSSENPAPWYEYRSAVQSVTFEGSVISIGAWAFMNCKNLADVTIPETVTGVGMNAFLNCALTMVTIPVSVARLEDRAFGYISNEIGRPARIRYFKITGCAGSAAETYAERNDFTFAALPHPSGTCGDSLTWTFDPSDGLLVISGTGEMTNWEGLTAQNRPWHNFRDQIKKVTVEEGVTALGSCAFLNCGNLTEVEIASTVRSFGDGRGNVFSGCSSLTSVDIPDGITQLPSALFNQCTSLQYVTIPDSVTTIRDYAFRNTALEKVTIPADVTRIVADDFGDCSELKRVTILSTDCEIYASETTLGDPALTTIRGYQGSTAVDYAKKYGYSYEVLPSGGKCGEEALWYFDPDSGRLIIYGAGDTWDWEEFNQPPWYDSTGAIKSLLIEDGVTSIGDLALSGCRNLTDVTISEGVTAVGDEAFCWCYSLASVTLPRSMTVIGGGAFANCVSLESITLPADMKDVGVNAFFHCPALTNVTVLSEDCILYDDARTLNDPAVTVIHGFRGSTAEAYANKYGYAFEELPDISGKCGDYLIWTFDPGTGELKISGNGEMWDWDNGDVSPWHAHADSIKKASIENGVTGIGDGAFWECGNMTETTIPDSVERIGYAAFSECKTLKSIDIPDSVTYIGSAAFSSCESLTQIRIPDGLTFLSPHVFANCFQLQSVTIPGRVTYIDQCAFNWCTSLSDVTILNGVFRISFEAFASCPSLTGITIPASMTKLENEAFSLCEKLTSVTILSKDCIIGDNYSTLNDPAMTVIRGFKGSTAEAYAKKYGYKFEEIPSSGQIGDNVTWSLDLDTGELVFSGSGDMWNQNAADPLWRDVSNLVQKATVAAGVTSVKEGVFANCSKLTSVTILNRDCAFDHAAQTLGDPAVTTVRGFKGSAAEAYANEYGYQFEALPDPSGKCGDNLSWTFDPSTGELAITGTGAMWEWPVTWDEIADDLAPWRDLADYILSVTVSDGVTSIGAGAFLHCVNMTRLSIPDGIRTIGMSACFNCQSLESLTLPEGVTAIGDDAFFNCKRLTSVTVPVSVASIGERAFLYCADLADVTVMNRNCGIFDGETALGDPAVTTVNGFNGSTAEAYANKYGYKFKLIPDACASGHDFGPWTQSKAPTCTEPGRESRSCTRCGAVETREPAALGHEFQDGVCVRCGAPDPNSQPEPDRTGLDTAVTAADALREEDYTPESFAKVREAVAAAMALPADADQNAVDAAAKAINDAIAALQEKEIGGSNPFEDVENGAFYYDPVLWAVAHEPQITKGTDATHFSPNATCTRGQVVTFLWRVMGCPAPASTDNPFTDVREGAFYYTAVLWAVENGITNGIDPTHFGPDLGCTRGQVVTFLWRAEHQPKPGAGANPFTDVTGGFYYDAVLWAVQKDITKGTDVSHFSPNRTCTRGQIVTFLYRDMQD